MSSVPKQTKQMKRENRRPKKKKVKEGVFPKVSGQRWGKERNMTKLEGERQQKKRRKGEKGRGGGRGGDIKTSGD